MNRRSVYLDYAAATPLDPDVEAVMSGYRDQFANPSAIYAAGRQAKHKIEACRHQVAKVLGSKKSEIVFTAGGTESVNLAILGVGRLYNGAHLITSTIEHTSVLSAFRVLEQEGHTVTYLQPDRGGRISPEQLKAAITSRTVLVSLSYVNSELGSVQPLSDLSRVVGSAKAGRPKNALPLWFHTDAAQAAGLLKLSPTRLGVDLMSLNGSKIYGPKATGCLYVKTGVELQPLIYGGGQERGLRSGSEDLGAIVGFATALEKANLMAPKEKHRLNQLRLQLINAILRVLPDILVNNNLDQSVPSHLNISIPGINGEMLVLYLDKEGFMVATGSACAAASDQPSHVLLGIGLSKKEANASLRVSLGRQTSAEDIERFVVVLTQTVGHLRRRAKEVK